MIVGLAAIAAMEHARRTMVRRQHTSPPTVEVMSRRALAFFWAKIADFCALGLAPDDWKGQPCAFFKWVQHAGEAGTWQPTPPP